MKSTTTKIDAEELYSRYYERVLGYVRSRLGPQEAEDVTAEVFVSAIAALASYDESKAAVSTWLFTIANNAMRDHLRRTEVRQRHLIPTQDDFLESLPDLSEPCVSGLLQEEMLELLAQSLERLSERERNILILYYYQGIPQKEIASALGLSYANVRLLCHKGVERLRRVFQEQGILTT